MSAKTIGYWVCTVLLVFFFLPGGIFYLMRSPQITAGVVSLGFPVYFVPFLGVWKVLGSIAIVTPRMALLKEWAYAGMFFDLVAAAVAHAATHGPLWHIVTPLAIIVVLYGSWALRPASRRLVVATAATQ